MNQHLNNFKTHIDHLLNHEESNDSLKELSMVASAMPDELGAAMVALPSDYQRRNYICLHQRSLAEQADLVSRHIRNQPGMLAGRALVMILRLLDTLEMMFPEHFDSQVPVPAVLYRRLQLRYEKVNNELMQKLQTGGIGEELTEIILLPFRQWRSGRKYTYRDHYFLKKYAGVLQRLQLRGKRSQIEETICAALVTADYNELLVMNYMTLKVLGQIEAAGSRKEAEQELKRIKAKLTAVPVLQGTPYDVEFVGLKQGLLDWIAGQQESLELVTFKEPARPVRAQPLQKMDVSVGLLAILSRLLKLQGWYGKRGPSDIAAHVVGNYATKKTESISRSSFINLFKAPKLSVAREMRRILRSMLEELEGYINTGKFSDQAASQR